VFVLIDLIDVFAAGGCTQSYSVLARSALEDEARVRRARGSKPSAFWKQGREK